MRKLALSFISVCIFFILTFSSLFSIMYNLNYYEKKYEQYNIYDIFTKEEARNATNNLFGFFKSENNLDMNFFNQREASHLQDVKSLIIKAGSIYYTSIAVFWAILIAYYIVKRKELVSFFSDSLFYGGVATIGFFIIIGLLYFIIGFDFLFLKFHHIFFTGNYAFNPQVSNMKALFPNAFFFDIGLKLLLNTFIKAFLITVAGFLIKRNFKSRQAIT